MAQLRYWRGGACASIAPLVPTPMNGAPLKIPSHHSYPYMRSLESFQTHLPNIVTWRKPGMGLSHYRGDLGKTKGLFSILVQLLLTFGSGIAHRVCQRVVLQRAWPNHATNQEPYTVAESP